jgi:glycosyltransferase involved in cell wall biosynthesis
MNILILTEAFPPEIRSASHLLYELADSLVEKGFQVTVITRFPKNYLDKIDKKYRAKLFFREKMGGINVIRLYSFSFLRHISIIRGLSQFILSGLLVVGGIVSGKQDIILAYSPPLPLGISAYLLGKIKKTPFIFNTQDIFPQSVIDLGPEIFKSKNKDVIRKKYGIPLEKKIILFVVANLKDERKGVKYFLKSLKHVKLENLMIITVGGENRI